MSMRGSRNVSLAIGLLTAAVIVGTLVPASSQDQATPTFRTEANYVRVDVYATTRDGTPVGDLRRDEFELLEDKVPQKIDQFATVRIQGGTPPGSSRPDPITPDQSRQAATDVRARVFVLFLDVMHVDRSASQQIARPLIDALRNLVGPNDLLAIVTPGMQARTITFTRQISTIENVLNRPWGARDRVELDPVEKRYAECYPGIPIPPEVIAPDQGIAQEMILRRREQQTLDTFEDLVTYLRDVREERKAVITITNGWLLYGPNERLARTIRDSIPTAPQVTVDPRNGRLTTAPTGSTERSNTSTCDTDRLQLSQLDHEPRFRRLLDQANRANVSFYPVDPRGVVAFDDDIVPVAGVGQNPVLSPDQERSRLARRGNLLRTMAEGTDGVAVLATNDFAPGLRRMTADLSAYYLLGYYSTGRLDGRFHALSVRVTRPGIQIRARRGYLAATSSSPPAAVESLTTAAGGAELQAINAALASLGVLGRDTPLHLHAAVNRAAANSRSIAVILEAGRTSLPDWARGGEADALLINDAGATVGAGHAAFAPGTTSIRMIIAPGALASGDYELRVRAKGIGVVSAATSSVRVTVPPGADGAGVLYYRRGPTTGNRETPTADLRFRRSDALRIALPAGSSGVSARLLDRAGNELPVPVTTSTIDEADGSQWTSAQVTLAPLAPGDYLIELTASAGGSERRTLAAFRVIP